MLRFASSPTGDMHIGDLRVALLNYIVSKQKNEDFIVRIDDMDKEKNIEGKDQEIADLLSLFNIEYAQIIYQSQNFRFHSAMALDLLHKKKAFACFCSDEWLEKKREEAKAANRAYHYDDACRNLPAELVIDNTAPFTVRIVRPDAPIVVHDKIKGDLSFEPDAVDSFIIMRQDKTPTEEFACAVDDMLSDVSLIIRSEENLNKTPKQIHVRNALGYDKEIEYAHLPCILDEETLSVKSLLEKGYLPEAISNYLISIGNSLPKEIFTLDEAKEWFTLEGISDSPARFDMEKLKQINKEHLKRMDATELSRYVGFADADIGELARIYVEEAGTTQELKAKIAPIFEPREIPEALAKPVTLIKEALQKAAHFEEYDDFQNYLTKETELEEENLSKALRVLLTNSEDGPDIANIYKYLKNYIGEIVK